MTEDQRDDLIEELSIYEPEKLRSMVRDYIKMPEKADRFESIYDYLAVKIEIQGYWQKIGLKSNERQNENGRPDRQFPE